MPTPRKTPEARQRHSTRDVGVLEAPSRPVPRADPSWSKPRKAEWRELHASPLASMITPDDLPTLRRLMVLRDRIDVMTAAVVASPTVEDPKTGVERAHPLTASLTAAEKTAQALEAQFGLNPLARLKLGATLHAAAANLDDLAGSEATAPRADPRGVADADSASARSGTTPVPGNMPTSRPDPGNFPTSGELDADSASSSGEHELDESSSSSPRAS